MNLGNAYGLGDHAKERDVLERALAIEERVHGKRDRDVLAATEEARDMLERASDDVRRGTANGRDRRSARFETI